MKKIWHHLDRTHERRLEAEFRSLKIPFKKRLDVVWFILVLTVFTVFILWWFIGVLVGHRFGIFDPPPVRPVQDPRILTNIRDNINENPLLDAVFHQPEGYIYLSQQGGTVHRFNPSTGLWSTENPFSKEELVNPGLILLRSGCGLDPLSYRKSMGECWDMDSLWGLTAGGGLVRRSKGQWEIVKSDTMFMGSRGQPVMQDQLTTAAVSPDNRWLIVGTQEDGIGVYNIETRQWLRFEEDFYKNLPSPEITHIAWCHDSFWIGGPGGLAALQPGAQPPLLQPQPGIDGIILDMDVDFQGRLWVLDRHSCTSGGMNCLRLSRFDFQYPEQPPKSLINESHIFPGLTLDDLHFARYWQDRLVVAGSAGVYSYDTQQHSWERHFKGDVPVTLPFPKNNGFYFGFTGGVGVVSDGRHRPWKKPDKKCTTWLLPYPHVNERIARLHHGKKDEVLALTMSGKLFSIDIDENKVYLVFKGERTGLNPKNFRWALAFGDIVVFTGEQNALIHNIVTRSYKDIPLNLLPGWIQEPGVQVIASGDQVYAAVEKKWSTHIYQISAKDASAANFKKAARLEVINGPVSRIRNWDDQGIGLIGGDPDGRVLRFSPQKEVLTGFRVMDMNGVPFLDAAPYKDGIIVATAAGLREYNYLTRTWARYKRFYGKSSPKEVVQCNDRVWMSTQAGQLLELTTLNKFEGRIGGEAGFDMTDSQLNDVLADNGNLYLGGNGWVNCYDPGLRRITDRWELPGNGDVRIIAAIRGQPLALTQGKALLGTQILDVTGGSVLDIFIHNDYIWTLRQTSSQGTPYKYLKRYPLNDPFSLSSHCYFYNPFIGGNARRILDAAELPDGVLAVSTEKGLYFYSPIARSWYGSSPHQFSGGSGTKGGRLHVLGHYLVRSNEDQKGVEISYLDLDTLQIPTSCSSKPAIINEKSQRVRAFALHPRDERMALLKTNGTVVQWYGGIELETLPLPGNEPPPGILRRIFHRKTDLQQQDDGFLLFTTARGILRYDLQKRFWSDIPMAIALDGDILSDINIESHAQQEIITAKTGSGRFFLGMIDAPTDAAVIKPITMKPLFKPLGRFNHPAGHLRDVQLRSKSRWTFVLKDRIKYFDPLTRQWFPEIIIPDAEEAEGTKDSFIYCQVKDRGIVIVKKPGSETWWIARQGGYHPISFAPYRHQPGSGETTALDNNGTIWRLGPDARLFRLHQPLSGDYQPSPDPYEPPFLLNSQQVSGAFEWPGRILFDTTAGLRALDKTQRKEIPLPENIKNLTGIREIVNDGEILWIRTRTDQMVRFGEVPENITLPDRITNQWSQLQGFMKQLPDGQEAYDPITGLGIDSSGRLMARRPGGETFLAQAAVLNPGMNHLPNPLDVGWLQWKRDSRTFTIKTPTAVKTMSPEEFIKDRQIIFSEINALLVTGPNQLYAANRYGIWSHRQQDLSLNDPTVTFQPVQWDKPLGAAHGYFITADGVYTRDGKPVPASQANHQVTFGDVTLRENIKETGIQGRVKHAAGFINAFDSKGFTWDHQKQGLAYTSTGLLVHSAAGLHPVFGYSGFEILPGPGALYSPQPDEIYLKSGQTWYRWQGPGNWEKGIPDPGANRELVDNPTWKWQMRNGVVEIQLQGDSYGFKLISTGAGLAFTSDLLQGAAVYRDRLMVMTGAFFEEAQPATQLSHLQAPRFPPMPTRSLQTHKDINKGDQLVLHTGSQYFSWNDTTHRFEPGKRSDLPYQNRLLAKIPTDNPRVRFMREPSDKIKKELKVEDVQGRISWQPFGFRERQFPFDLVTSIAAGEKELYIGTDAGLQVYTGKTGTGLGDITTLYQLRGSSGQPLAAVEKVGIPLDRPGVIMAYSAGECLEKPAAAQTFRKCPGSSRLGQRLRHQTAFWQFVDHNGRLMGQYKDRKGSLSSEIVTIKQGGLPHDLIKDIAIHAGQVFTLWNNGWISRHDGLSIELNPSPVNYNTQPLQPQRFILADQNLYIEGIRRRVWQYDTAAKSWKEVTGSALVEGLLAYSRRQPIVNRKRFRLMDPAGDFEYRGQDDRWHPLPWKGDGIDIDQWTEFLYLEGKLWAATPQGLISFSISRPPGQKDKQVVFDPDNFIVIPGPQIDKKIPEITDLDIRDNIITLRCHSNSDLVFQGTLDGQKDQQVFTPLNKDPFAGKIQVSNQENNFWQWNREGCKDFHPGRLNSKFHEENLQLVGGRFVFDSINSIAFFRENQMEIGTDSGGWYSVPIGEYGNIDLHVSKLQRPKVPGINPTLVKEVRISKREGETILGLRTTGEGFIRLGRQGISGKTDQFPQYLGSDGFWRYSKEDGQEKLSITTVKSTGPGQAKRQMQNGRFTDDIVLGLPASGTDKDGPYVILPTEAGILRLDEKLNPAHIYPKNSLDLPNGMAPRVLYINNRWDPKEPLFMAQEGFHPLSSPRASLSRLKPYAPAGAVVLALEEGPQDFVRYRWEKENQRGWTLVNPTNPEQAALYLNTLYVNLREFNRFSGSSQPWMQVKFTPNHIEFLVHGANEPYRMDYPGGPDLLAAMVKGKRLLLIGKTDLWEINLEHALSESF